MVSKEILEKFKKLYQEKFNITLTDEEATRMATDLVNLMRVLLKPDFKPEKETKTYPERRQNETIGAQQL